MSPRVRYHRGMAIAVIAIVFGYAGLGLLVAIPMCLVGLGRLDPAAAAGTWGFRVLSIPGVMVLWPVVLGRWLKRGKA